MYEHLITDAMYKYLLSKEPPTATAMCKYLGFKEPQQQLPFVGTLPSKGPSTAAVVCR